MGKGSSALGTTASWRFSVETLPAELRGKHSAPDDRLRPLLPLDQVLEFLGRKPAVIAVAGIPEALGQRAARAVVILRAVPQPEGRLDHEDVADVATARGLVLRK